MPWDRCVHALVLLPRGPPFNMHLSDILKAVPESAVKSQRLDVCAHKAVAKKKPTHHVDVTFATTGMSVRDLMFPAESENVGLIVWIKRSEWIKCFEQPPAKAHGCEVGE